MPIHIFNEKKGVGSNEDNTYYSRQGGWPGNDNGIP